MTKDEATPQMDFLGSRQRCFDLWFSWIKTGRACAQTGEGLPRLSNFLYRNGSFLHTYVHYFDEISRGF
jgi:hypothetical protein